MLPDTNEGKEGNDAYMGQIIKEISMVMEDEETIQERIVKLF